MSSKTSAEAPLNLFLPGRLDQGHTQVSAEAPTVRHGMNRYSKPEAVSPACCHLHVRSSSLDGEWGGAGRGRGEAPRKEKSCHSLIKPAFTLGQLAKYLQTAQPLSYTFH